MTLSIQNGTFDDAAADGIRNALKAVAKRGFTNLLVNHGGVQEIAAGVFEYTYTEAGSTVTIYRVVTSTTDIFYSSYTNSTPSGVVATRGEI